MDEMTRRQWIKRVGAVGGAAVIGPSLGCGSGGAGGADGGPGPDGAATALAPVRGDGSHPFDYVDTLVIVQMENRSFDHMMGSLSLLEGRKDIDGLTEGMTNPSLADEPLAIGPLGKVTTAVDPDPPHGHEAALMQWNEGANDGFVRAWQGVLAASQQSRADWIMGYYTREDLPFHYFLADHFAVCDRWHCSLLGPTWPNRFYSHAATSNGNWDNTSLIDAPTPYRKLLDAGYSFGIYKGGVVYFLLTLRELAPKEHNAQPIERFYADAAAGTLPNVSIVEPNFFFNDDHPPADIVNGQAFLSAVYEALRRSPQWDRSLMVVFYDEHGGFHDHVAPPTVKGEERAAEGFAQLGFRIPGFVVGPLARRGAAVHTVLDHASVPALISNVFGLEHVNERSRLAGDIGEALDLALVQNANRPAPPAFTTTAELSLPALERTLEAPRRTEIMRMAAARLGLPEPTRADRARELRGWLDGLERLGVARVR